MRMIVALFIIALILVLSEILWRHKIIKQEIARKFVHILAGSFIAFLPFYLGYTEVKYLAVGFLAVNLVNHFTKIFNAIHAVDRKTWGDVLFSLAILILSILAPSKWIFAGAILNVALADGLAAVFGSKLKKHEYKVFGVKKSLPGSLAFLITSTLILSGLLVFNDLGLSNYFAALWLVPLALTGLENVSILNTDNLVLPVGFIFFISLLQRL